VLDLAYRGSAGSGRDSRADIARALGQRDVDGSAVAARYDQMKRAAGFFE
jgi:hypothetical protein